MDFYFREHASNGNFYKYKLPEFFTTRGFNAVETASNVEVGVPTSRNPDGCCDYNPHTVKGLSSACDEVDPNGPEVFGDGKNLPDPKIAEAKTDKPNVMPGAKPVDDNPKPKIPTEPQDHSTPDMTNFTDWFSNFHTIMKSYAEILPSLQGLQQQSQLQPQRQQSMNLRKRKSDSEQLAKSYKRLPKKSKVRAVRKR